MFKKLALFKAMAFLIILAAYFIIFQQFETTSVNNSNEASFATQRAFNTLSELLQIDGNEIAHPVDSKANQLIASRIIVKMRSLGYQEESLSEEFCLDFSNGSAKCAKINNILFRLDGSSRSNKTSQNATQLNAPQLAKRDSKNAILLSAHYDSVSAAPGASDAGTAVATLIEIAESLSKQPRPLNDIIFLFNDGEEAGLLGARAFMRTHPYAKEVKWVLNLDAIGSSGRSLMIETDKNNSELINVFSKVSQKSSSTPIASSFISFLWENMPSDTDMTIFKKHGLSGLNFINLEGASHYHTPLDSLSNVDLGSLEEHGEHLLNLINHLKNKPMIDNSYVNQQVYQDVLGMGIVHWDQNLGIAVSLVIFILFLGILSRFRYEIYQYWQSVIKTTIAIVFLISVAIVAAVVLKKGIQIISLQLNSSSEPWFSQYLPMQFYMNAGVLVALLICHELIKNYICYPLLLILTPLLISAVALVSAIFLPKISTAFIIVSMIHLVILSPLLIRRFRNSFTSEKWFYRFSAMLMTAISLLIFVPNLYLLEVMMNFYWTPVIGFFIGVPLLFTFGLVSIGEKQSSLIGGNKNSVKNYLYQLKFFSFDKILVSLIFISCIFWVLTTPVYTPDTPNNLNIQYVQIEKENEDSNSFLLAGSKSEKISQSLKSEFDKTSHFELKKIKPWSSTKYISKKIRSLELNPVSIKVLSDVFSEESRVIRIGLEGENIELEEVKLFIAKESGLKKIVTENNLIDYSQDDLKNRTHYGFHCIGTSCGNLVLSLEIEKRSSLNLRLVETRKGLPKALDYLVDLKGAKLIEKGKGDRQVISQMLDL